MRGREILAHTHIEKATFFIEEVLWPQHQWSDNWRNEENRWYYTQLAFLIITTRIYSNRCQCIRLSDTIPPFIRSEVVSRYEDLIEIEHCPMCYLPMIDNFANETVHGIDEGTDTADH